jgi:hypothetical protein
MYTYKNSFHGTEYISKKSPMELLEIDKRVYNGYPTDADKAFVRRMRKALCGVSGCKCGDVFGRRW